jgi:hypothetical protein
MKAEKGVKIEEGSEPEKKILDIQQVKNNGSEDGGS